MRLIGLLLLLIALFLSLESVCSAAEFSADLLFAATFDNGFHPDYAQGNPQVLVHGAQLVSEGKSGGALSLQKGQYISLDPAGNFDIAEGTLMFWLKPDWLPDPAQSHTLLSMALGENGATRAYFVLSQGWWETSGGAGRIYFILDNQARMHASTPDFLTKKNLQDWHHIAITWTEGGVAQTRFINLYIDGDRVARTSVNWTPTWTPVYRPTSRLFIGSDQGAGSLATGRSLDGLLDELLIYNRPFTDEEIKQAYDKQGGDWAAVQAEKWTWLTSVIDHQEPNPPRDAEGRILETRALFDEGYAWTDPANIPVIVAKVKQAGFNAYMPCIWHGAGARWPSASEPVDPGLAGRFRSTDVDPLAELIRQMHAAGIEVHPWFTVAKREQMLHPEFADEGTPEGFFNVHLPAFREHITNVILEVVRNYDVDGINLDYVRTGGYCTSSYCQEDYSSRYGRNLLADVSRAEQTKQPVEQLLQWQDDAVAEIIKQVAVQARQMKPELIISVDGRPKIKADTPSPDGRNEVPWVDVGWVDVVYFMDYDQIPAWEYFDALRAEVKKPEAFVMLLGNYDRALDRSAVSRDGKLVADLVLYSQIKWPGNGVGLYLYSLLNEDQMKALRMRPFKEDALTDWRR